jgi:hypothetical protein
VASAGDVNGDGFDDLLVGFPGYSGDIGNAYLYLGSASALSASPTGFRPMGTTGSQFGGALAGAGDVDGDGFGDVLVGMPGANVGVGAAYYYPGGPAGLMTAMPVPFTGPGARGAFGFSLE